MPVSGLVLTLTPDADQRAAALDAIRRHPAIHAGQPHAQRLPIVVDTPTQEADVAVWKWLHDVPGVLFVDLVCANTSDDPPPAHPVPDHGPMNRSASP